jgi:hypothetical protein
MSAWNDADNYAIAAVTAQTQAFEAQGDFGDDDEVDRLFDNVEMLNGVATGPVLDVEFEDEDEDAEDENAESAGVSWQTVGECFSKPLNGRPFIQGQVLSRSRCSL